MVTNLTFLRRPTIGLGARAAHQHRSLIVAETASLEEGLDGLLIVDDGVCACPVRAPQAAPQASNTRASGSQMSGNGYGSRDSVQAPLTLITAFLRFARSSTFDRSTHGLSLIHISEPTRPY